MITLAASFFFAIDTSSATTTSSCREQVNVLTFHVEAKSDRPVYTRDQKVILHVKVTRPAHEDPAGYGNEVDPPDSEPAAGIYAGASFVVGDSYSFGFGVTDEKGKADIEMKLDQDMDTGPADVNIYAWYDTVKHPCLTIREYGHRYYEDMFRII